VIAGKTVTGQHGSPAVLLQVNVHSGYQCKLWCFWTIGDVHVLQLQLANKEKDG